MAALRGALVTGASSGIGRAVALRLAEAGFVVAACGRSSSALESAFASAAPAVRARVLLCGSAAYDLAAESGCAAVVAAALDALRGAGASLALLVNNAGGGTLGSTLGDTRAAAVFDATLALDLRAPFVLTSLCAPLIASAWPDGSGAIINVSSVCGQRPMVGLGAYCIAKAGVEMLTKQTALEFAGKLRCTCVAPATVVTDFHARAGMTKEQAAAYYGSIAAAHPVGRVGAPEDVAELIAFLADGRKSSFMTGNVINCDGGRLLPVPASGLLAASK